MHRFVSVIVLLCCIAISALGQEQHAHGLKVSSDTTATKARGSVFDRIIEYFESTNKPPNYDRLDISFVGGPHYSSDTKLGLGLIAAGAYRSNPKDSLVPPSNLSIVGDVSTVGFWLLGISGTHVFPSDKHRLGYNMYFYSFPTYFWGIGYSSGANDANKTKYDDFRITSSVDFTWRLARGLYLGPIAEFNYVHASDVDRPALWRGEPLTVRSYGGGFTLKYDIRDHLTNAYKGILVQVDQRFFPRSLGNGDWGYSSTQIGVNGYKTLVPGSVLAIRFHTLFTYGHTPWGMLATVGGRTLRGYYEGRYRDKCEADLTIELRQHIAGRSGIAIWAGLGEVFRNFGALRWGTLLPNGGIGYRWEFKKRTNVRLDLGFGRGECSFIFNVNEAF